VGAVQSVGVKGPVEHGPWYLWDLSQMALPGCGPQLTSLPLSCSTLIVPVLWLWESHAMVLSSLMSGERFLEGCFSLGRAKSWPLAPPQSCLPCCDVQHVEMHTRTGPPGGRQQSKIQNPGHKWHLMLSPISSRLLIPEKLALLCECCPEDHVSHILLRLGPPGILSSHLFNVGILLLHEQCFPRSPSIKFTACAIFTTKQ
jgi:hypothetical protein